VNASVIALGILLAGGVLLTASCWGRGAASRSARILLIAGAAGSVMVGLVPVSRVMITTLTFADLQRKDDF
jgi:hypothetical protein